MRYGLEEAKRKLIGMFDAAVHAQTAPLSFPVVMRLKVPLIDIDIMDWLLSQELDRKVFFRSMDKSFAVAGIGVAFEVSVDGWYGLDGIWPDIQNMMDACPQAKLFTGMSFLRSLGGAEWDGFSSICLMLPAVELIEENDGFWLVVNAVRGKDGQPFDPVSRAVLDGMCFVQAMSVDTFDLLSRKDIPDYEDWVCSSEAVAEAFIKAELDKVVLARRATFEMGANYSLKGILKSLMLHEVCCDGIIFLFSVKGKTFLSVVSEPLYAREGNRVTSKAFSEIKGGSETGKNAREHRLITGAIIEVYREFCRFYQVDSATADNGSHEILTLSGEFNEGVADKEFLQALHPAASVCGLPAEKARHFLQQYEIFDRGWFSGPVGFFSKHSTHFASVSRACLWERSCWHIFAGAAFFKGDVRALAQWEEAGSKISSVTNALMKKNL